ncbi:RNA-binding RNA processing protein rpp1 [Microbotryomycetes sp. JL201]|nr:RNA-binding RNA processing protein rpp1 [Microbotryomycetes sp. JL201]
MHGYIDSFPVPVHPPKSWLTAAGPSTTSKGKHKQPQQQSSSEDGTYNVTANWTPAEKKSVQHRVEMAARLGYSTVVLVIHITPTTNPSTLVFPTPLMPELDPRTASSSDQPANTTGLVLQLWRIHVGEYSDSHIKSASVKGHYGFSNSTASLFPPQTSILSVTPTSVTSFSHVCLSLSAPSPFSPTIVSIDPSLNTRLPFPLKRGLVSTLLRSGLCIEIVYRGIVKQEEAGSTSTAATRRRNWISGAREIVRALGGSNIVLSSGAESSFEMRASQDLINLCTLIGLTPVQAKNALTSTPRDAIMRGLAMRQTHKGVISNPSLVVTSTTTQPADPELANGGTRKRRESHPAQIEAASSKKRKT